MTAKPIPDQYGAWIGKDGQRYAILLSPPASDQWHRERIERETAKTHGLKYSPSKGREL